MNETKEEKKEEPMTYGGAGIPYNEFDAFKVFAQKEAEETAKNISDIAGVYDLIESRGESVHLIELPDCIMAHLIESLGTKIEVARAMEELTGISDYYANVAMDTMAMIINDLVTLGPRALSANMFLAPGNSNWFKNEARYTNLIKGWRDACDDAECTWGGGETPVLPDIVNPDTAVLAGSAIGIVMPKSRYIKPNVKNLDAIILIECESVNANGITLTRRIAKKLPKGYLTKLEDGRTYGDWILIPTPIFARLVKQCLDNNINIHYIVNITGHGWRKLARFPEPFVYVIEKLPEPKLIFKFIQEHGPVDIKEMYETFDMGAVCAIFVPEDQADRVISAAEKTGFKAIKVGYVEKRGDEKKVLILPEGLELNPAEIR